MSDALTINNDDRLEAIAVEIETIQGVALLKIGERLLEAQDLFKYQRDEQGFGGWVDRRLRFGQTTAYKLISVFTAFGAESVHNVDTLPKSVLYALAEPSTPPSLRAKALSLVKPGKPVDDDALAALKRELADAKQAAKNAKRDERMQKEVAQKANDDRAKMLRDFEWEKSRAETLAKEVERLKQDNVIHYYPQDTAPKPAQPVQPELARVTGEKPAKAGHSRIVAENFAKVLVNNIADDVLKRMVEMLDWTTAREIAEAMTALLDEEAA